MKQALVGQGTDREQGNSHLEWASQPPPFLVVPEKKLPDPHFKTLMPMMTRGKTKMGNYMRVCVCVQCLSCVWLFATPWIVACQAPLSMGFSRQEYWSGLSFPPPGDLPDPGIKPVSPALVGGFFTTWATWEAWGNIQSTNLTVLNLVQSTWWSGWNNWKFPLCQHWVL